MLQFLPYQILEEINLAKIDKHLIETDGNWAEKIAELEALLAEVRPQLIEAEAELADRLAKINAFEFKVRTYLEPLAKRLEKIQAEIDDYRQQLRRLQQDIAAKGENDFFNQHDWVFDAEFGAASGDYRYREAAAEPPSPDLSEDESQSLKQVYRQLARRFHPDLALDDEDRAYRTNLMKAINAAYAAGDLARLQELAQEPDSADRIEYAHTDQQLVQALYVELTRCQRRLVEIQEELAQLENHKSAKLQRRAERAAAQGRDLLVELSQELQSEIDHKLIERDVLQQQVAYFGQEETDFGGNAFANAIYDLNLEGIFDEEDETTITARWPEHPDWDDDILDDLE
jgi:predicted  nucleic acid-binding Zn-ribbon protein